jgi:hypothetical protein
MEQSGDEMIARVPDGARQRLPFEIDGDEPRVGIDVLVARHAELRCATYL